MSTKSRMKKATPYQRLISMFYRQLLIIGLIINLIVISFLVIPSVEQGMDKIFFTDLSRNFKNNTALIAVFILIFILLYTIIRLRKAREYEDSSMYIKEKLSSLDESDFSKFEEIKSIHRKKAMIDFERNLSSAFTVESINIKKIDFFDDCEWKFQPGINLLLGRNGYGKSFLLRTTASLLQRNEEISTQIFIKNDKKGVVRLNILKDSESRIVK